MMTIDTGLLWQLGAKDDVRAAVEIASQRFAERLGRPATAIQAHPDDAARWGDLPLLIVADAKMLRGHFLLAADRQRELGL